LGSAGAALDAVRNGLYVLADAADGIASGEREAATNGHRYDKLTNHLLSPNQRRGYSRGAMMSVKQQSGNLVPADGLVEMKSVGQR
jgi:hypothetical protein